MKNLLHILSTFWSSVFPLRLNSEYSRMEEDLFWTKEVSAFWQSSAERRLQEQGALRDSLRKALSQAAALSSENDTLSERIEFAGGLIRELIKDSLPDLSSVPPGLTATHQWDNHLNTWRIRIDVASMTYSIALRKDLMERHVEDLADHISREVSRAFQQKTQQHIHQYITQQFA